MTKSITVEHQYSPKDGSVNEGFGAIDAGEVELFVVRAGVAATAAASGAYLTA